MTITCPQCGFSRSLANDKIPDAPVIARCPKCNCRFRFSVRDGVGSILPASEWNQDTPPSEADIREAALHAYKAEVDRFNDAGSSQAHAGTHNSGAIIPWAEAPGTDGWFAAFWRTVIAVMFSPGAVFKNLTANSSWKRPCAFFVIISICQILLERIWALLLYSYLNTGAQEDPQLARLLEMLMPESDILLLTGLRLGSMLVQLVVFSFLIYLGYRLVARGRATYRMIFDIMCYGTAPWLLAVIPGAGSLVGTLWGIWCVAMGCKSAITLTWAETIAGFLPLIIITVPMLAQLFSFAG